MFLMLFLGLVVSNNLFAQWGGTLPASNNSSTTGSGSWVVPDNVYSITFNAWGGGGAGGAAACLSSDGAGGGAGGVTGAATGADPEAPMDARRVPTATVESTGTSIESKTPDAGDGISVSTLSVET